MYVHLHCHSAYSLHEGTAKTEDLVAAARRCGMSALALTDRNNLYSAVSFYIAAQKAGIKPIIGMEVDLEDGTRSGSSLVLLARNMAGYRNLCHLSSALHLNAEPDTFSPAGFEEGEEIQPWDSGVWGRPLFGFTPKPQKLPKRFNTSPLAILTSLSSLSSPSYLSSTLNIKDAKLTRQVIMSGRHTRGLIALSCGSRGLVNKLVAQGKMQAAARTAGMLLSAFGEGNFFIEITACNEGECWAIPDLATLAADLGIPLVATNDVLYLDKGSIETAAALAAVAHKPGETNQGTGGDLRPSLRPDMPEPAVLELEGLVGRHFATAEEMAVLFKDYPQAIANTQFIAEQCNLELPLHKPVFPGVDLGHKGSKESPFSRLWKLCFAGATRLYKPLTEAVLARLKYELEVIEQLGFSPYFLVVWDIAHFARRRGIPIMARGSAANSLVAYVLGITQVDPIAHDLLFERFLNPSRAEIEPLDGNAPSELPNLPDMPDMPDIDLDLCWRRRDEVLHYVYEKYGHDHVAIVGTHITFRLRSAWREMAKAMDVSPERIERIAARLPHLFTAKDILEGDDVPELSEEAAEDRAEVVAEESDGEMEGVHIYGVEERETLLGNAKDISSFKLRDKREQRAFELCQAIEGLPRHMGMHCAGVVITPGPIADLVPLQRASRDPSMAVTQYEKDAIEAMGLVKIDLLGSRALTTLVDTAQAVGLMLGSQGSQGSRRNKDVHASLLTAIPFDDAATYRMLAQGDTLGCFQLESPGMRGLLKWLRPKNMQDIAAAISLFRPGPLTGGFLETFMRRRLGQEPVEYPHPSMERILKNTYGVILYQEQFLRLAHQLAGVSLGDAEKLRKEIGKAKSAEGRTRLGSRFVAGCIERGIDQLQAERVWEVISGYTGFGFCEAHAHSYALTAYRSAYMKAHYPAHFMAAQINNQGGYYGTAVYVEEARRLGVELRSPHINKSGAFCEATVPPESPKRCIRFGLQFIKGLTARTIALIISERQSNGSYHSLHDLLLRVEMPASEAASLVKVGACDGLGTDNDSGDYNGYDDRNADGDDCDESVVTAQDPYYLNRRQMLSLLPTLVNARKPRLRRTAFATGTYGSSGAYKSIGGYNGYYGYNRYDQPLQIVMDDFLVGNLVSPRILGQSSTSKRDVPPPAPVVDFTREEQVRLEQEVLGFALTHNQMALYAHSHSLKGVVPSHSLSEHAGHRVSVAGVIAAARRHLTKGGGWMLFMSLQDSGGLMEVVLFPDTYKKYAALIANTGYGPYRVSGTVQVAGRGRGVGVQPPEGMPILRPSDAVALKTHPVIIAEELVALV